MRRRLCFFACLPLIFVLVSCDKDTKQEGTIDKLVTPDGQPIGQVAAAPAPAPVPQPPKPSANDETVKLIAILAQQLEEMQKQVAIIAAKQNQQDQVVSRNTKDEVEKLKDEIRKL